MEILNDLVFHIPAIVIGLGLVGTVYLIFGKGLAFRIFAIVVPMLIIVGLIGHTYGKYVLSSGNTLLLGIPGAIISISAMFYLYRITIVPLQSNVAELKASSSQLSATAAQSASTAEEQAGIVSQVSTTTEEISQISGTGAASAQEIVSVTSEAVKQGQQGQATVREALSIMTRIGQVSSIVDTVNQLSEQSNLLAVNAGIEAAKAGEYGRGFAVVASEVRNLAEQSRKATMEIRAALGLTEDGRRAIQSTMDVIEGLMLVLEDASDRSRKIAGAAMQQAAGIKQINEATLSLKQAGQDSAASAAQIEQAVRNLEGVSEKIVKFIGGKNKFV